MIAGGAVSWVAVTAICLSNVPEGLSSSAGMKKAGHSAAYVFGLWTGIALISGLSSLVGYTSFFRLFPGGHCGHRGCRGRRHSRDDRGYYDAGGV